MHIKSKLYPYPVLSNFNDDYFDSYFNINVVVKQTPREIILNANTELNNEEIETLILNKQASYCLHIECPLTSYRQMIFLDGSNSEIKIGVDEIEGVVNICPFIIAIKDIKGYKNSKFNSVYENLLFDLEKGNFIAFGEEMQIRIEKESDNLSSVPSIFAVTEIKDESRKDIIIDNTGHKINVQLPSKTFNEFKLASLNPNSINILHSMVIIPALMKCFEDLKSRKEEFYLFEDKRWFRSIKKAMGKFNIDLNEDTIIGLDSFEIAQRLMDSTTNRAILSINDIAFKGEETDE